ncbi:MAG: glycoside hydrolase [Kiritimatiellae bacterium]|nr:glycoside hydrolase [Kiritimatiellia bacterium]
MKINVTCLFFSLSLIVSAAFAEIVQFKDAAKIKSWDAWGDKAPPTNTANRAAAPKKERKCVTWIRLNELNPGLKEIGRLAVRDAKEIKSSKWSIGCETMDRDYADWNAYKAWLGPLGVKHGRLFSGWAKTEQEKGVYDFTWFDPHVREMAAMSVKPWICLAYGNPVWGSDFRLGMKVKQVTDNPEAFEAWLRYCTACVNRYKDVVDEWEIWNEPFGQGPEYAEMFYRTAKAIRAVQPNAKIFCTAVNFPKDYTCVLDKLKQENALELGSYFIYHPYYPNPDTAYDKIAVPLRKLVKSYSDAFDIMQGETGCPSQLEFAHALSNIEWSEYAQAKWDLRRTIGDAAREIPCNVFTMIDLQYTFMLQSFGLIRSNTLKEFVYRRPSYYAMQNVFSLLDDEAHPVKIVSQPGFPIEQRFDPKDTGKRTLFSVRFARGDSLFRFMWFSDSRPSSTLGFDRVKINLPGRVEHPVWVEMITGRVFEIPAETVTHADNTTIIRDVPMWDSPVMVTDLQSVPMREANNK